MLTAEQANRLECRRNRLTRYEVVLVDPDGEKYRLGYTPQPSRRGLLRQARCYGDRVVRVAGLTVNLPFAWRGKGRLGFVADLGNGWTIRFTGRTERDAIVGGEIIHITQLP